MKEVRRIRVLREHTWVEVLPVRKAVFPAMKEVCPANHGVSGQTIGLGHLDFCLNCGEESWVPIPSAPAWGCDLCGMVKEIYFGESGKHRSRR